MNPARPSAWHAALALVCVSSGFFLPLPSRGAAFLSNLAYADHSGSSSSRIPFGRDINNVVPLIAQEFRTGPNAGGYSLNTVTLSFDNAIGGPNSFTLKLYNSASGAPNLPLGQLTGSSTPTTQGNYDYAASGLTLQPNSDYFLVLQGNGPTFPSGNNQFLWFSNTGGAGDSNDGWLVESMWYSFISGGSSSWTKSNHTPGTFQIDATVVPEPSLVSLILAGALFYLLSARR